MGIEAFAVEVESTSSTAGRLDDMFSRAGNELEGNIMLDVCEGDTLRLVEGEVMEVNRWTKPELDGCMKMSEVSDGDMEPKDLCMILSAAVGSMLALEAMASSVVLC